MTAISREVAQKILESNRALHRVEADLYDLIHPEIFGTYEQGQTNRDLDFITTHLPKDRAICAMDIGCGTGNITLKLLAHGYNVRAVDISDEMLGCLRAKLPLGADPQIELVLSDAEAAVDDPRTYGTYDLVSFSSVLHHLPDYMTILGFALQQLRRGGLLWVCHEPLAVEHSNQRIAAGLAGALIGVLDSCYIFFRKALVYLLFAARRRSLPKRIDYSWSDFHARGGIAAPLVLRTLEARGARIMLYETYTSRFSSILARCDSSLRLSEHRNFRFIAQTT